jgi:hypothetical protein
MEKYENLLRFGKAIRIKSGTIHNNKAGTFHARGHYVGVRFAVVGTKRVWLQYDTRAIAKDAGVYIERRLRTAASDDDYNQIIRSIIDQINEENPEVTEEVVHGDGTD